MKKLESITGFYYIGSDRNNISKLVSMYKRGYASSNFKQAMTELAGENHILPEVICCESRMGFGEIKKLALMLANHPDLAQVPLLIDADMMTMADNYHFIRNNVVDDILNVKEWDEKKLHAKIRFLQKFKIKSRELEAKQKESFSEQLPGMMQTILKRGFDILVSLTAIIFLTPVFLVIAIAIRAESKGNIFYVSKRAGKGYRIFDFYKFRTMIPNADLRRAELAHMNLYKDSTEVSFFKIDNDPRISRVGKFLRNTSLDELPQLLNVLLGDMSLVGNRPLPLYEAENLTTDTLAKRFLAPAGITGLWQIKKRGQPAMSVDERMELDIDYADKSNFMYDLWIMANTPQALFQKANT